MSPSKAAIVALLVSAVLSACGSAAPPPPEVDEHKALQRAIQEPLDKARAVEEELQKQQKAMQRQMDDAEE